MNSLSVSVTAPVFSVVMSLVERVVGGDDGTPPAERSLTEQGEIFAGLVDARYHEEGVAALVIQARLHAEVEDDVIHHAVHAGLGTEHLLHGAPLLAQRAFLPVIQSVGFGVEPGVY